MAQPTDPEDERIEVGVVIVGGGPGGLACAIRLTQLLAEDEALMESLGEVPVALVEKGKGPGSHLLSGAMMKPSAMQKLFPDLPESDWPTYGTVDKDTVYVLPNRKRAIPLKPTPPPFRNHGNHVTSVAQLGRWLSQQAEEAGVYILGETSGYKLLVEDGRVVGVRSGDKGRGRDGQELSNFEPGSDLIAKATVLAEGTAGHLTGAAIRHFDIGSEDPQQWELGVKEIWEVQQPLDRVIHTMGWPLQFAAKYREFGGSFIYPMGEDKVSMGLVVGLDYRDARFSVHDALQELKSHPLVAKIIEGGKRVGLGREDDPLGRLLGAAAAALGAGHGARRGRRRHGQRADAQGRPLRDARGHVRRRGDLRAPEGRRRLRATSRTTRRRSRAPRSRRTATARATCASRSPRASSSAARSPA